MSTNFYLKQDPKPCDGCQRPTRSAEIHIGKRSVGWVFTWQGFDGATSPWGAPLNDAATWRDYLTRQLDPRTNTDAMIEDENGVVYTLDEFFAEVESLRHQRKQSAKYPGIESAGPDDVLFGEWF